MYDGMDFGSDLIDGAMWSPGCIVPILLLIIGLTIYLLSADSCSDQCEAIGAKLTTEYDHCLCVKPDGSLIDPDK